LEEMSTVASDDQRKAALAQRVGALTAQGWRMESQMDYQAVLVKGHRPNHVLHLILSVLTAGLWLIVWAIIAITGGEKRMVVIVNESGQVRGA
jgi:hypothetical protein